MANKKVERRKLIDKTLSAFGVVATVALLAIGGLAWWGASFVTSNVHDQLAEQKIYFPAAGSAAITALPAADQAEVAKYAGQQVLTGKQAEVYADHFIAVHLKAIGGGKTYSEISEEFLAMKPTDPGYAKLAQTRSTLFQGETLRGLLLGDAYAFGTIGQIAKDAALVAFVAGAVMAVLTVLGFLHMSRL